MSAELVLRDRLLELGEAVVPGPDPAYPGLRGGKDWRYGLVMLLRKHKDDRQVASVAALAHPTLWAAATLASSEEQAAFHDGVMRLMWWRYSYPSEAKVARLLDEEKRPLTAEETGPGARRRPAAKLTAPQKRWLRELLLALGWTPPIRGETNEWTPPGAKAHRNHQWGPEQMQRIRTHPEAVVRICTRCGSVKWVDRMDRYVPMYLYAASLEARADRTRWHQNAGSCEGPDRKTGAR
jgi:hypothetical protein